MKRSVAMATSTYLRKPTRADAEEFIDRVRTSRDHLLPFVHAVETESAFRQWLARGQSSEIEQFLCCDRDGDAIVGFVNLNQIQRGPLQTAAAGWASFVPHTGRGHLTEGLSLAFEVAFSQLRLHRVEANIQPTNERSRALAVRCGMRLEGYSPRYLRIDGIWCDHERWALLEDDWRALRANAPT